MFSLLGSFQYLNPSLLSRVPAGMASELGFDVTPSLGLPVSHQAPCLFVHGHTGMVMWPQTARSHFSAFLSGAGSLTGGLFGTDLGFIPSRL